MFDFFLVPQNVRQGTVSPTHYIVVEDTSNYSPDVLQRLSYKLCFLYYNWPGTVRVPACCQVCASALIGSLTSQAKNFMVSVRSQASLPCWTIFEASTGGKSFRQTLLSLNEVFYFKSFTFVNFFSIEFFKFFTFIHRLRFSVLFVQFVNFFYLNFRKLKMLVQPKRYFIIFFLQIF